jgi:hypothetical protein
MVKIYYPVLFSNRTKVIQFEEAKILSKTDNNKWFELNYWSTGPVRPISAPVKSREPQKIIASV